MIQDNKETNRVIEAGYIEKGTGKHQSNTVYYRGGLAPTLMARLSVKNSIMIIDMPCVMTIRTA